jgi:hypothetical protein
MTLTPGRVAEASLEEERELTAAAGVAWGVSCVIGEVFLDAVELVGEVVGEFRQRCGGAHGDFMRDRGNVAGTVRSAAEVTPRA